MFFKLNAAVFLALASAQDNKIRSRRVQSSSRKCMETTPLPEIDEDSALWAIMGTMPDAEHILSSYNQYRDMGESIGSNTGMLAEASDASVTGATIEDGMSGDTDFPFMDMKTIMSMGERSVCPESYGQKLVGVPDGMGAYLADDDTVRVVFQSESYGPLRFESFPLPLNDGTFTMGGSQVQYVDYDRTMLADFLRNDMAASEMVVGAGNMIETAYNLKGELIGPRNMDGPTQVGAHYGNTDAEGNYVVAALPTQSDWFYQSFCSAHLEEKHQWGEGIGLEDDLFITNEEWITYAEGSNFVGIGAHVVDIHTKTAYAVGVFGQSGYEKIVEINPQHPDYVMFSLSGYTGAFRGYSAALDSRNELYAPRTDGKNYTWTNDITPARIYIGVKGKMEDGSDAPADDFLARNGLRYGSMYGYAVDMKPTRQSKGLWRDDYHRDTRYAKNGASVKGRWIKQEWRWDGEVRNYEHDAAWEFQDKPPFTTPGSGRVDYEWWTGLGPDTKACKTEHNSPDPRAGNSAFVQSSTCGYYGHYYVLDVVEKLDAAGANGRLPNVLGGNYRLYQGEVDVRDQIILGDKGQYVNGADATMNYDNPESPRITFEDIDGFEVLEGPGEKLYAVIQEDSGNAYGERMFLAPLEHDLGDGQDIPYYFLAMSGGSENTRMQAGVCVPKGTFSRATGHEFSGIFDISGFMHKDSSGAWTVAASDSGRSKRMADASVPVNEKHILICLQAHTQSSGVLSSFQLDRGGQIYIMSPKEVE